LGLEDVEGLGLGDVEGLGLGDVEGVGLGDVEGSSGSAGGATLGLDGRAVIECLDGLDFLDGLGVGDALGDVEGVRTAAPVALGLDAPGVEEPLAIATASPPNASTVAAAEVITTRFTGSVLPSGCSIGTVHNPC
jgi:hypothetical protein